MPRIEGVNNPVRRTTVESRAVALSNSMSAEAMSISPDTQAIHSGREIDPTTGAITAPIHLSTTFERGADGSYPQGYIYGRSGNPNRDALEVALATLEKGREAATFASGSAATFSLLQALGPKDHVIAPQSVYYGVQQMLSNIFAPWGLGYTLVDTTDLAAVAAALRPNTRLVLIETPSNPQLDVTDIRAVADLAPPGQRLLGLRQHHCLAGTANSPHPGGRLCHSRHH
jgi:cystathionine gamma-synthase